MYATRKELIYKFNRNGIGFERGFPKKTRKIYKRAPKNAGAAVKDRYGRVYMFKGRLVLYNTKRTDNWLHWLLHNYMIIFAKINANWLNKFINIGRIY